jgi:WD40 repeat protein
MSSNFYQAGGTLPGDSPAYVVRRADGELYAGLREGQFCYVLNSRQMGKSSLRVRVMDRLRGEGVACAAIDITAIGSQSPTLDQWYAGVARQILSGLGMGADRLALRSWWKEREFLPPVDRLGALIEWLLAELPGNIAIFVDEIDSVLSLKFPIDDFFAFIRSCYNVRVDRPEYERITFALFGVATPGELIQDKRRTPFNIGRAIELEGFREDEVGPLAAGFGVDGDEILREVLGWTEGQPFLTQRICQLAIDQLGNKSPSLAPYISEIVQEHVLTNWEANDQQAHLKTIRDRILSLEPQQRREVLCIYQDILTRESLRADNSVEQMMLRLSGLVVKRNGLLVGYNQIYQAIFDARWVKEDLEELCPFSEQMMAWLADRDPSRLLWGQALTEARSWSEQQQRLDANEALFIRESQDQENLEELRTAEQRLVAQEEANRILQAATEEAREKLAIAEETAAVTIAVATKKANRRNLISLGLAGVALTVAAIAVPGTIVAKQAARKAQIEMQEAQKQKDELAKKSKKLTANLMAMGGKEKAAQEKVKQAAAQYKKAQEQTKVAKAQATQSEQQAQAVQQQFAAAQQQVAQANATLTEVNQEKEVATVAKAQAETAKVAAEQQLEIAKTASKKALEQVVIAKTKSEKAIAQQTIAQADTEKARISLIEAQEKRDTILNLNKLEKEGLAALNRSILEKVHGLIDAMRAGEASQALRKTKGVEGFAASPTYAIQTIVDQVENRALLPWQHQTLLAHESGIFSAQFSPDSQHVITSSDDKTARIWDVKTGQEIAKLQGHESSVSSAQFSPDGKHIVTSSDDNTARIWDSETGQEIAKLKGHESSVSSAQFSPDGKHIVTSSDDNTARIWDSKTGQEIAKLKGHESSVSSAQFSPDGKHIVTSSDDNTARIWDSKTGQEIAKLQDHKSGLFSAQFSPDGQHIVTSSKDNTARIWDSKTGQEISKLKGITPPLNTGINRSANRLLYFDSKLRFIPLFSNAKTQFSPNGQRIVTVFDDMTVRVWDVKSGEEVAKLQGHESDVISAQFSPDGQRIVTASDDKTSRVWDAKTGQEIARLQGHESHVITAQFSPDGQHIVTASSDGTSLIWDFNISTSRVWNSKYGQSIIRIKTSFMDAQFSSDTQRIVTLSGADSSSSVWDTRTGQEIPQLDVLKFSTIVAQFSPDGQRIVTDQMKHLQMLDIKTGQTITKFQDNTSRVGTAKFSPDGQRIVTTSKDKTVQILDTKTGQEITKLQGHESHVYSAQFSPNGQRIVTASEDKTSRVWDAETGLEIARLQGHEDIVVAAQFSPDGQRIVTASADRTSRVWDARTGQEIAKLQGHASTVYTAQFSPDGQRIVTASEDKTSRVWDAGTGQEIARLQGYKNRVVAAQFSPDGQRIITASSDGIVRSWPVENLNMLLVRGCTWLKNYLIVNPQTLNQLSTCQTKTLTQAALPYLISQSEAQAREGKVTEAIQGFTTAKKWDPSLSFDPKEYAEQLKDEEERKQKTQRRGFQH